MTAPRTAARRQAQGVPLRSLLPNRATLPCWVFRALSFTQRRRSVAAWRRVVPDLRPQFTHLDYRYDV